MRHHIGENGVQKIKQLNDSSSTSTSNKCVARGYLGLCPTSPYSVQVDGERTGVARC